MEFNSVKDLKTGMVVTMSIEGVETRRDFIVIHNSFSMFQNDVVDKDKFELDALQTWIDEGRTTVEKITRGYYMSDEYSDEVLWEKPDDEPYEDNILVGDMVTIKDEYNFLGDMTVGMFVIGIDEENEIADVLVITSNMHWISKWNLKFLSVLKRAEV